MQRPALGIDLGGTKIEALLLGPEGFELWRRRVATPAGDYAATVRALAALVEQGRAAATLPPTIGIGTPGAQTAAGLMKNCNSTCLNGQPLQRDIEAVVAQRVVLANDANCLALSEATDGAGAGAAVVFAAILGTGVGGGIAVHGRVLRGANGIAGEWGHNPLPWAGADDPRLDCYCGRRGCIERFVSGPALAADHTRSTGCVLTAEVIAQQAAAGDASAVATLNHHAQRLARALAGVVNLLDPDVIVLGGGLSQLPQLTERVGAQWGRWVFGTAGEPLRTRLVTSAHGDASGVRGAAWLGREAP